ETLNENLEWTPEPNFTNLLVYTENIYAAYLMAGNKSGKFSYQGGLRGDLSDITSEFVQTDTIYARDYFNLFPSAHLSYELSKGHFLQLGYSYRINRPRHWWLSPFFTFADSRNFMSGNPNLNPEFIHSTELGYLKQWEKGSVLTNLYYRHTRDQIVRIQISDSTGFTRNFPVNLGTQDAFGLEVSGSYPLFKWWTVTGNANYFYAISEGNYEGVDYGAETFIFNGRITSKWRPSTRLALQTSFDYDSPRNDNQGRTLARYAWDIGASLDVLKNKGTLSFSGRDILNTRKRRRTVIAETFTSVSSHQWRARQFLLNFSYRINQKKRPDRRGGDFEGGM
ncbi:MAG: outer membrane beta-barrel family protein, partial [Bacteroidota bacterium]